MCSTAGGWKWTGRAAATRTAALTDVPEDEHNKKHWSCRTKEEQFKRQNELGCIRRERKEMIIFGRANSSCWAWNRFSRITNNTIFIFHTLTIFHIPSLFTEIKTKTVLFTKDTENIWNVYRNRCFVSWHTWRKTWVWMLLLTYRKLVKRPSPTDKPKIKNTMSSGGDWFKDFHEAGARVSYSPTACWMTSLQLSMMRNGRLFWSQ